MSFRLLLLCALAYVLLVSLSIGINQSSLWTDEAFSAWLASHETARGFSTSLLTGDSSDLQAALYYSYLFLWARLLGTSELALRTANIPFVFIFGFALVWTSWSIFRSRFAWVVAGMIPFAWYFASEARGYMAVLAFSAAGFASLLGFIRADTPAAAKKFPWISLASVFLGCLFHMLFLLAVVPALLIVGLAYRANPSDPRWRLWKAPLAAFALPFCALAGFFAFTFTRGSIDYSYPHPGLRQMASVLYELAGFFNYGPNRKFSLDFRAFAVPVALGGLAILLGGAILVLPALRKTTDTLVKALAAAAVLCFIEVPAFCFVVDKQVDARHLAGLVPIFLFLLMGLIHQATPRDRAAAVILLGGAWFVADLRGTLLPEYQKEDYRDAVRATLSLHNQTGAVIALASDPVAPAYYGLDVRGPDPCYPLHGNCTDGFNRVPWPRTAPALAAGKWSRSQILKWLSSCADQGMPVEILVQLDRSLRNSPWWPVLAQHPTGVRRHFHGFDIVILNGTPGSKS